MRVKRPTAYPASPGSWRPPWIRPRPLGRAALVAGGPRCRPGHVAPGI